MKPIHLPISGHDLLAVERYRDDTRHMIEFLALQDCPMGHEGQYLRQFLSEEDYARAREQERCGFIRIRRHFTVIEGHILPDKPKKRRR